MKPMMRLGSASTGDPRVQRAWNIAHRGEHIEGVPTILSTEQVAAMFRGWARGLTTDQVTAPTVAPAADVTKAMISIAGDLPMTAGRKLPDTTFEGNSYVLYDLAEVPAGGCIWRLSTNARMHLFVRWSDGCWRYYTPPIVVES